MDTAPSVIDKEYSLEPFFHLSLDLLCIAGTDGFFKRVSPSFTKVLGFTPEELLSKSLLEFIHPDDRKPTLAEIDKQSDGRPTIYFENRYICKDGSYKWLAWTSAPSKEGLLYAVARDITQQKAIEKELQERTEEAEKFNNLIVDRELEMVKLKEQITELQTKLETATNPSDANPQ